MLMHERDEDTLILRGTTLFDVHMYTHSSASQNAYLCNGRARSSLIGNAVCISCTHRLHSCKHCLQLIHTPSAYTLHPFSRLLGEELCPVGNCYLSPYGSSLCVPCRIFFPS